MIAMLAGVSNGLRSRNALSPAYSGRLYEGRGTSLAGFSVIQVTRSSRSTLIISYMSFYSSASL